MTSLLRLRNVHHGAAVMLAALIVVGVSWTARPAVGESAKDSVTLVVDYGDHASKTVSDLAWKKGDTVLDAMKAATARPHSISFSYTGTGANAVLTKIDGVANAGGGAGKKNWQYWVNGDYGDRSFGAFELHAQDVVIWRYATEQGK